MKKNDSLILTLTATAFGLLLTIIPSINKIGYELMGLLGIFLAFISSFSLFCLKPIRNAKIKIFISLLNIYLILESLTMALGIERFSHVILG